MTTAVSAGTAFVDVEGRFDALRRGVQREGDAAARSLGRRISQGFDRVGAGLEQTGRTLTRRVTLPLTVLGGAIVATGVSYNALEQRARAAFTTILGGAEEANRLMDDLREFAKTSPFPRQAFIEAAQRMIGFGFEASQVVPILETVQDAVAAIGGTATDIGEIVDVFNRIQSQGRITGDELNRLGERGIDAAAMIADAFGVSVDEARKMISEGQVDSEAALDAITQGMEEKFGGAAENVKTTWDGVKDRIAAAWRDLSSALVEPFVSKEGGGLAIEWANTFADTIRDIQESVEGMSPDTIRFFAGLGAAAVVAGPALAAVGLAISGIGTLFTPAGLVLGGLALLAGAFFAANVEGDTLAEKLEDIGDTVEQDVIPALEGIRTSWDHDVRPTFQGIAEGLDGLDVKFGGLGEGFLNVAFNISQVSGIIGAAAQFAIGQLETMRLVVALVTGDQEAAQAARERIAEAEIRMGEGVQLANETFAEFHSRQQRRQRGEELETLDTARFAQEGRSDAMGRIVADHAGATESLRGLGGQQRADMDRTGGRTRSLSDRFSGLRTTIEGVPRSVSVATSSPGATLAAKELRATGDAVEGIGRSVSTVRTAINMSFEARKELHGVGDGLGIPIGRSLSGLGQLSADAPIGDGPGIKAEAITRVSVTKQIERLLGLGGGRVAGAVGAMMGALRGRFPGLALISGFRPGARTLSGALSYHARGRAVDVPAVRAVAEFIRSKFGAATKELITPWRELDLHNGRPHRYSAAVHRQHNFAGGNAHVHWAMADGGIVRRPIHALVGESGPEAVVPLGSDGDLIDYDRLAQAIAAAGVAHGHTIEADSRQLAKAVDTGNRKLARGA